MLNTLWIAQFTHKMENIWISKTLVDYLSKLKVAPGGFSSLLQFDKQSLYLTIAWRFKILYKFYLTIERL